MERAHFFCELRNSQRSVCEPRDGIQGNEIGECSWSPGSFEAVFVWIVQKAVGDGVHHWCCSSASRRNTRNASSRVNDDGNCRRSGFLFLQTPFVGFSNALSLTSTSKRNLGTVKPNMLLSNFVYEHLLAFL